MKHIKKSFTNALFAFLMLSFFTQCEQKKKDQEQGEPPKEEEVVEPPAQIISLDQARETYTNYTERRVGLIEKSEAPKPDGSKFEATRYTYYDYETMKQYMAYIEQEAKRANVKITSLRFYLSNYPDTPTFENGNEVVHPRQNSVFLIPATRDGDLEYPFIIDVNEEGEVSPLLLTGQLDPRDEKGMGVRHDVSTRSYAGFASASSIFFGNRSLIMNEGSSAPPPNQ